MKYFSPDDANYFLTTLRKYYKITAGWAGENYCGLNIKWDYAKGFVDISMPNYIHKALKKSNHKPP